MKARQPTDLMLRCEYPHASFSATRSLTVTDLKAPFWTRTVSPAQYLHPRTHLTPATSRPHMIVHVNYVRRKRQDHLGAVQKSGPVHRAPFERKPRRLPCSGDVTNAPGRSLVICARLIPGYRTSCLRSWCERKRSWSYTANTRHDPSMHPGLLTWIAHIPFDQSRG